jgi:hypothetical protein
MTAIRVVFDGKAFVPQHPVSLKPQSVGLVIIEEVDAAAQRTLDEATRAYYQGGGDADDDGWGQATSPHSQRAWDED